MKNLKLLAANKTKITLAITAILLLAIPTYSNNKIITIVMNVNYNFVIPVACVFALGVFLFSSFMKQKHH
jgi:hypothetical protein